ncbi:YoaK family protein [Nocardia sp. AG03]|uniref:YoaK family protein n=1 Tax=Nocardia sp. AG03 TaxID=3025312 RepID=UPI0024188875|nr:YoaK family protein [Nocardia sp. AG03]
MTATTEETGRDLAHRPPLRGMPEGAMPMVAFLSILAGFIGAAAYTHSAGYFVTFMTGNTERAVLGWFDNDQLLATGAITLLLSFGLGVFVASLLRRRVWRDSRHGATVVATVALSVAAAVDWAMDRSGGQEVGFIPIAFVAFAVGALNTAFVKNGEVSVPLSYVTGTVVKLGQGIESHVSGGSVRDWLGYALQYGSFAVGALLGGVLGEIVGGDQMLLVAAVVSGVGVMFTARASRDPIPAT